MERPRIFLLPICAIILILTSVKWGSNQIIHKKSKAQQFTCTIKHRVIEKAFARNFTREEWSRRFSRTFGWPRHVDWPCHLGTKQPTKRYCPISKNLSRQIAFAFCRQHVSHLHKGSLRINAFGSQSLSLELLALYSSCRKILRTKLLKAPSNDSGLESLFIVRNPLDRFVSAWLYICNQESPLHCLNCPQNDICCFTTALTQALMRSKLPPQTEEQKRSRSATVWLGVHLMPQNQFYGLNDSRYDERPRVFFDINSKQQITDYVKGMLGRETIESGWGVNGVKEFLSEPSWHKTRQFSKEIKELLELNHQVKDLIQILYAQDYEIANYGMR